MKIVTKGKLPMFSELLRVWAVPQSKLLGIVVAVLLQARWPSFHPINSGKPSNYVRIITESSYTEGTDSKCM